MMLTDLADACRKSGLKIIEQPSWKQRGHGQMGGVKGVACHHTAGPKTGNSPSLGVVQNGRPGLTGPLAHLVLARDGTVYVVAAGLCYHAGVVADDDNGNYWMIGIEAEATGVDPWPAEQYEAYARLCAALAEHYGFTVSHVLGHKEIAYPPGRKTDPNFNMDDFRQVVADEMEDKVTPEDINKVSDQVVAKLLATKVETKNAGGEKKMLSVEQLLRQAANAPGVIRAEVDGLKS